MLDSPATVESVASHGVTGDIVDRLLRFNMDPGCLRPYRRQRDGKTVVSLLTNQRVKGKRVRKEFVLTNTDTTLTRDAWEMFDSTVIDIIRPRLSLWNDLRASAPALTITDGMGVTILKQQRRGDITPATTSMDGRRKGQADQPQYDEIGLPLPIIHKDFEFSARDIAVSRRGGQPLDLTNVEMASWHVANAVDDQVLGQNDPFEYAGYSIYGYLNWPEALTGEFTSPTEVGWKPDTFRNEVLTFIKILLQKEKTGPFDILYGTDWMEYMGRAYSTEDSRSLSSVLVADIEQINSCSLHTKIPGFKLIIRERSGMTARAVIAMEVQTIAYTSPDGMVKGYKIMCIMVPQLRSTITGQAGILVADVAS